MSLFVKSEAINIAGTEITIKEIGVDYLLLSKEDKQNSKKLLELHTSLNASEIENLTMDAFQEITSKFYDLNSEHFSEVEDPGEDGGK